MSQMSNRFSALLDNNNERNLKNNEFVEKKESGTAFSENRISNSDDNRFLTRNEDRHYDNRNNKRRNYESRNNMFLKKETKPKIETSYDATNNLNEFPDLPKEKSDENMENKLEEDSKFSFLNALQTKELAKEEIVDKIPDGWVVSRINSETKTIIKEYGKVVYIHKPLSSLEIMQQIANHFEDQKQKYIDTWGHEEYEKMYMFPNYDYNYFDRLDEKYEQEMESFYRENYDEFSYSYSNSDYEIYDDTYE